MELKLTSEEIASILKDQHKEYLKNTIEKMIEFYRRIEKEFQEGDGKTSAIEMLNGLLQDGMKFPLYLKIREAVIRYNTPYEVIVD